MAFHGLRQVCGQTQHSGRSSRPDWDRNEAYCVQCSAESPAHSGCGKGPWGHRVPRLSPSPACPRPCEGQDVGTGDRMEGELMRERGSPGTQGVALGELPHPILSPLTLLQPHLHCPLSHLHPLICLEVYSATSALAAPTTSHTYPSMASFFPSHPSINVIF